MLAPGQTLANKYRVERVLGQGGMGLVLGARHLVLDEPVAIKVLTARDERGRARLLREARAAAKLRSDHVVRVLDVLELDDGEAALVLEHVDGVTLADELAARGALPVDEAVRLVLEAAHGVAEAHARGIVHRDLKPSNLLLSTLPDGRRRVRVIDFGVAKLDDDGGDAALTASDALLGSPAYMSPEQIRDPRAVDARSDVWSLGVVLYELSSGALPFEGYTTSGLLARIVADPPISLDERRSELDVAFVSIVMECLSREPTARPASVAALAARLAPFTERGDELAHAVAAVAAAPRAGEWVEPARVEGSNTLAETVAPDLTHRGTALGGAAPTSSAWPWFVTGGALAALATAWLVWPRPPAAPVSAASIPAASAPAASVPSLASTSVATRVESPASASAPQHREAPPSAPTSAPPPSRVIATARPDRPHEPEPPTAAPAPTDPLDAYGPRK